MSAKAEELRETEWEMPQRSSAGEILDEILEMLRKEPLSVEEISKRLGIERRKVLAALQFLSNFDFIELCGNTAKIKTAGLELLELPEVA